MILYLSRLGLTLLASATIASIAWETLGQILPTGDVLRLARAIELNAIHRQGFFDRDRAFDGSIWMDPAVLASVARSPALRSSADDCLADPSRAAMAVQLGLLDQGLLSEASDRQLRSLVSSADRSVAQRLKCAPTDGNAWLIHAHLAELKSKDLATVTRALDLSYLYASSEKWVMLPRLRFVGYLIDVKRIAVPPGYGLDLERFIEFSRPNEIAGLYADGGEATRGLMRTLIDGLRLDRRVQVLRHIDALGVSYPVPAACRSTVSHGLPGAELELRRPADLIAACAN